LSDESFHPSNIELVKTILRNNCYPPVNLINKKINERLIIIRKNKTMENEKMNENSDINKVLFHISEGLVMELKEL